MTTDLEGRVRDVLARQAAALQPPDVRPDDAVVVDVHHGAQRRRGRILVAAAAAALLVLAGVAIANRNSDSAAGSADDGSASSFHYATPQVQLDAASITVDAGGRTFVPPANVSVHSDPGTWNQYTTLELEWDAGGVPMRIYIYFASDGTDWWATEMRTYDGSPGGEWIEMTGEYFRSPLGTAFQGDVDVSSLHMHGLKLLAFPRPTACDSSGKPLALVANYPTIESVASPNGGYAATVTLVDTTTCAPTSTTGVKVVVSSDSPDIAPVQMSDPAPTDSTGIIRFEMNLPKAGTTTVHVAVYDKATNVLIDQVDIPVIVSPAT